MRSLCLLLTALFAFACPALAEPVAVPDHARPRVGLVLGGGGARGAAHIGVLQVLERERIPVHAIAGTSMGAIVGGLYATGYDAEAIARILAGIDWADALRDEPPRLMRPMRAKEEDLRLLLNTRIGFRDGRIAFPQGFIQGQRLMQLLRRLLLPAWNVEHFDQLAVPFRCVSTDIASGEAVVFDHGDLALAVRASMSVPGAFSPVHIDGRLLVDGGLADNIPAAIARDMGAQRLIVVDVGSPLADADSLTSPFAISMQMIDVMMRRRSEETLAALDPGDILLRPDLGDIGSISFQRAVEGIEAGRLAAEAALPRLRELALSAEDWQAHLAARPQPTFDEALIAFVEVLDADTRSGHYVENRLGTLVGRPVEPARIDDAVNAVYGGGGFETIDWRLRPGIDGPGVAIHPVDKRWGPNFLRLGLRLSDDFEGRNGYQLIVESTATGLNDAGAEWRNTLSLGAAAGLRSEWYQPTGALSEFYVQPYIDYRAHELPLRVGEEILADYRLRRARLGVEGGWNISPIARLSAGVERGYSQLNARVGSDLFADSRRGGYGAVNLGYVRDTLDEVGFPSTGSRFDARGMLFTPALGSAADAQLLRLSYDRAWHADKHRWLLGARGQVAWGRPDLSAALAELGGFLNVSGYGERELLGLHSALLRGVYYRRLGGRGSLFSIPAYIGASLEAGNVWSDRNAISAGDLRGAGSLFIGVSSPFGPIFLGYGLSEGGTDAFYLHFGSLLRPAVQ